MTDYIDVVFDGPPGPVSGRFVEVEDMGGRSISIGRWVQREDGYWVLRITWTAIGEHYNGEPVTMAEDEPAMPYVPGRPKGQPGG